MDKLKIDKVKIEKFKSFCISKFKLLKEYSIDLAKKLKALLLDSKSTIHTLLRKGGLKLRLIGMTTIIILVTVITINSITISIMTASIEKKAFEVSTTTIERIADFSSQSLLERTYENRLNLTEMIKEIEASNIEGLLDISIYESQKKKDSINFKYLTGFDSKLIGKELKDKDLRKTLNDKELSKDVFYESSTFTKDAKDIDSYRFVKPIIYNFKDSTILLGVAVLHYDKEAVTGVVSQVINLVLLLTLVIVALTVVLVYFAGLQFTRPILAIAKAASDVSRGNLNINLKVDTNDEIEDLADRFNDMTKGLREREKMQKFVSSSTIDMISDDSKTNMVLGGEYSTLTFLFSDIRGFTSMSETRRPQEVVSIINFYLNLQSEIIKSHGGDIDKFVGDEVMATFSGEDASARAIQSAIDIQKKIDEENTKRKALDETICEVGIGINSGEVIVGNIGSHDRMDFTSIGSEVNLAARLCSSATPNEILIEKETYEDSNAKHKTTQKEPIVVKGISKPVSIYSINITED